jgi:hypothetical protein
LLERVLGLGDREERQRQEGGGRETHDGGWLGGIK